jgi:hypothetical protein
VNNMKNIEIRKKHMMTLDEHRKIGKILRDARNELVEKSIELDGIYGKSKGHGAKVARITKLMDELRSKLDDKLFNEYPDLETKDGCKYYY